MRRTSTVDLTRPDGLLGPLVVVGAGRDLLTPTAGEPAVLATASTEVVVDFLDGRRIRSVTADPAPIGLDGLVGLSTGSGFRRALAAALPDLAAGGGLVHLLLDELTPGTLVSGTAFLRAGSIELAAGTPAPGPRRRQAPVDICAGWAADGAMVAAIAETGTPFLAPGPTAPSLDRDDDPDAWHEVGPLPPGSVRRRRLIDVGPSAAAEPGPAGTGRGDLSIVVRYRDTFGEDDGTESVIHEYGVLATVDPASWILTGAVAEPGPLPAPECPSAAASAGRLVGRRVAELRALVRDEFTGPSTCTHLNDVFRSLADVDHLWTAAIE